MLYFFTFIISIDVNFVLFSQHLYDQLFLTCIMVHVSHGTIVSEMIFFQSLPHFPYCPVLAADDF